MLGIVKNQKGFTLIELMVVVLIIAILIAIAIPVYGVYTANAEKRACQANLRILQGAVENYKATNDAYPAALSDLWTGNDKVIKKEYKCPSGTASYNYDTTTHDVACPNNPTDHTI